MDLYFSRRLFDATRIALYEAGADANYTRSIPRPMC